MDYFRCLWTKTLPRRRRPLGKFAWKPRRKGLERCFLLFGRANSGLKGELRPQTPVAGVSLSGITLYCIILHYVIYNRVCVMYYSMYMYACVSLSPSLSVSIYIYIERERERERYMNPVMSLTSRLLVIAGSLTWTARWSWRAQPVDWFICVYIYIYICVFSMRVYIYIYRERERDRYWLQVFACYYYLVSYCLLVAACCKLLRSVVHCYILTWAARPACRCRRRRPHICVYIYI